MSKAITVDLLVIVPVIYFLIIRKRDIPKITVFTVFVLGLVLLSYFLPEEHQQWLELVKTYALPLIEMGVVSFVLYKVVQLSKAYRRENVSNKDFYSILKEATTQVFPKKLASVFVTEISLFYYGIIKWKPKKRSDVEFTYHKDNGLIAVIIAVLVIIAVETVVLHLILVKWNVVAAWILTILSMYTGLQLFALMKSFGMRPITIDQERNELHLKYGYFIDVVIDTNKIESVELYNKDLPEDKSIVPFSPLGEIGGHNVILHFKEELHYKGMYGIQKKATSIALFIDDKARFKTKMEELLVEGNMLIGS